MFDIGNVLELKAADEEEKAGKQQVVEESHYCDGGQELGLFYPKLETGKTRSLSDTFVTMQDSQTKQMH